MTHTYRLALLLVLGVAACGGQRPGSAAIAQPVGLHNVLTVAELEKAKERTLYEVIQKLRPSFFRSRQVRSTSTPNPEPVHVFIDGTRAEGLDALKLIAPTLVQEVRFYEPQDANVRFGTGHHGGLIAVTLLH